MKKRFALLLVALLVLPLFAGCAQQEEGPVTITYYGRPDEKGIETTMIEAFEKENPNIKVNYVELPESTDQKLQTINTMLQAKDPAMDLFVGDVVWTPIFASADWVLPLDDYLTQEEIDEHVPGAMKAYTYRDHVYGIPFFTDGGMLYYRTDLLEKYNKSVPTTWDELIETASYIMAQEKDPNLYGYAGSWKQYEGVTCSLTELVWSHGGDFLDKEGNVIFDSPESVAAMTVMEKMVHEAKITPQGVGGFGSGDMRALALNGQMIFTRDWPSFYSNSMDPEKSSVVGKIKYTVLPHAPGQESYSTLGGWGIMVSNFTDNPEEAVKFAKFRSSYESQKQEALLIAHLPTRKALYEDADIVENEPWMVDMLPVMMSTNPRPQSAYYAELSAHLQQASQDVIAGNKTPEEAVKYAAEKMKETLGQ